MASSKGDKSLADKVALLCYKHFDKLPKKGKPVEGREWTIIAAIVKQNESKGNANLEVVSMGTGSKCIGQTKLSSDGDLLNDSHAEIMARRGFLRYLYHQVEEVSAGKESSVLTLDPSSNKFHKKTEVSFIFFSSHTPCGDASIILKENCAELIDSADELQPSNITLEDPQEEPPAKMQRLEIPDVHRTGAKCVESGLQDPKCPGINHHIVGVLRTKPGRGDQTLSMSCSDKLAKWNILGIQGSLLMNFLLKPVYISQLVIGKCPFSQTAIDRALVDRFEQPACQVATSLFKQHKLNVVQSELKFKFSKEAATKLGDCQLQPCPSSIIWCACPLKQLEVAVEGRKQGVTKKNQNQPACRLEICKKNLFQKFVNLLKNFPTEKLPHHLKEHSSYVNDMTYNQAKQLSTDYFQMWERTRAKILPTWTVKPSSLTQFTVVEN